ncbi:MAG: hypothetical protein FWD73_03440 [Polyangiaceae bacterium]|nr:hypothetical protein [Polyangiaceae bacterium]
MDNSNSISARPDVSIATTTPRVTPTQPRTQFKEVLSQSLVRSAETAMKVLPGAPLMAVALRGASGAAPSIGVPLSGTGSSMSVRSATPEGPVSLTNASATTTGSSVGSTLTGSLSSATGATNTSTTGSGSIESSLQQSQEMNLYYLQIQETVNQQNRSFTTVSNVLKTEHDTVKNAIGNLR